LVLHGAVDTVNAPAGSANKEHLFTGPYQRSLLQGVGHFPQREAPQQVAQALLDFVRTHA
jgi:pimeloyl-ACP methyl ester carboxylesterase